MVFVTLTACPGPKPVAGQPSSCPDRRPIVDCDAEIAYQGIKTEGEAKVFNFGAKGSFQDTELRQCNDRLQAYIAATTRICRQYNGCVLTAEQYRADAREQNMLLAGAVAKLVESAPPEKRKEALEAADVAMSRVGEAPSAPLSFKLTVEAQLPGQAKMVAPPNYPLPTGTEAAFKFEVSRTAYVYLFQVTQSGKVNVLFPDKRIPIPNPLPASAIVALPDAAHTYLLDDKDLGRERVFIVASLRPLEELEETLKKVAAGKVDDVTQDSGLTQLAAMDAKSGCPKSRGFGLATRAGEPETCVSSRGFNLAPARGTSLEARASSGDDVVAKAFPFLHIPAAELQQRLEEYKAANPSGSN
jgi:hypothetical protein